MMKILVVIALAHQFLVERDWLQFHNPKNDAMNILVEACELIEPFIAYPTIENEEMRTEVAREMADVLFALFGFLSVNSGDILQGLAGLLQDDTVNHTEISYEELRATIIRQRHTLPFGDLRTAHQLALSLVAEAGRLCDVFIWSTAEKSHVRAQEQKTRVYKHLAAIFAHLVLLAEAAGLDLLKEYESKMALTAAKYPVHLASGTNYAAIKDQTYTNKGQS